MWTSKEGIYAAYDTSTQRLYFPDGTFWFFGVASAGTEQDAGTLYPTQFQDTNGNQILLRYGAAAGLPWTGSSARIVQVEDVRAVSQGSGVYASYNLNYNISLSRSVQSHTISGDLDAQYSYDNEGKMTSVTYPQSSYIDPNTLQVQQSPVTTYTYGFDTMGRPTSMTGPGVDIWGNPTTVNIVNNVQYGPACEMLQMSYFGATETRQYNNRLQMTHLTVPGQLNISYNFASSNNGQISSQTDNLSGEQITYQYDALKRLYSASARLEPDLHLRRIRQPHRQSRHGRSPHQSLARKHRH